MHTTMNIRYRLPLVLTIDAHVVLPDTVSPFISITKIAQLGNSHGHVRFSC